MDLNLYVNQSEDNRINKQLTNARTISGHFKQGTDILSPVITFAYDSTIKSFNYAYIPTFNRFYFITDMKIINNTIELSMRCDVLMSHKQDILKAKATLVRSNKGSLYLQDERIKQTAQHSLIHRKIGIGFTGDSCYALVIATYGGN